MLLTASVWKIKIKKYRVENDIKIANVQVDLYKCELYVGYRDHVSVVSESISSNDPWLTRDQHPDWYMVNTRLAFNRHLIQHLITTRSVDSYPVSSDSYVSIDPQWRIWENQSAFDWLLTEKLIECWLSIDRGHQLTLDQNDFNTHDPHTAAQEPLPAWNVVKPRPKKNYTWHILKDVSCTEIYPILSR